MSSGPIKIESPLVIIYEDADGVICRIYPSKKAHSYKQYGMLVCDLVLHVARAFKVDEADVWECVEDERYRPTTKITRLS